MKPVILAFTGLMGSGKTTAALYLCEYHDYRRIRFAGPLKDMCYAFGLTADHIEGHLKEEPCNLIGGKSPRQFMQLLGTEFGRNMIDPDLWIRAWEHAVKAVPEGVPIVVDDCRFPNEADTARRVGSVARICRITRVGNDTVQVHASELQTFKADWLVDNDGTVEDLHKKLDRVAERVTRAAKYV